MVEYPGYETNYYNCIPVVKIVAFLFFTELNSDWKTSVERPRWNPSIVDPAAIS